MTERVLLLASHAVAEFDDVRMFHDLGYDIFAPGGYEDPSSEGEGTRPPLPQVPYHADFAELCRHQREQYGEPGPAIDWAKARIHDDIIDWADAIIVHHFPDRWIGGQWSRIRHKRVVWRTCGQSNPELERFMSQFTRDGLQVVRYSPREQRHFERRGAFAGQDALIRFGKYPADYGPWTGESATVGNLTQDMPARGNACGYGFWMAATAGLPAMPAGKGSEQMPGGLGVLSYDMALAYLRSQRVYLYTGTTPASYTLGLIEAMLSGVPVVSIDAESWGDGWDGADLFEGAAIAGLTAFGPDDARTLLTTILNNQDIAQEFGEEAHKRAIELFGIGTIGPQWKAFLG